MTRVAIRALPTESLGERPILKYSEGMALGLCLVSDYMVNKRYFHLFNSD